jgi:hypothetical protein
MISTVSCARASRSNSTATPRSSTTTTSRWAAARSPDHARTSSAARRSRLAQAGTKWPPLDGRRPVVPVRDGDDFHFMDTDTYDQFVLTAEQLDTTVHYLKDG